MDPLMTPLLVGVLGNLARELIMDASQDHLKDKLKSVFGWLETLGERDRPGRVGSRAISSRKATWSRRFRPF